MNELYAFWKYDLYPFVCGGPVVEMRDDGWVQTKNFGKGYWFKPIHLLPLKAGEELHRRIKSLECARVDGLKQFNQEWNSKLQAICPFIKP